MIFVLAGAKPVSMRYDPALMSIGCPSRRWFLGLFLCRLVPVRRWLQTFILWLSDLLSVGLRQWNHHWIDTGSLETWCVNFCWDPSVADSWGGSLWLRRQLGCCQPLLLRQHLGFRRRPILYKLSSVWLAVGRLVSCSDSNFHRPVFGGIGRDPSDFLVSEVDLLFFRVWDGSLLKSIRFSEVGLMSLNAAVGWCNGFHWSSVGADGCIH